MQIQMKTIPHASQLYPTCGNWTFQFDGSMDIEVSDMQNEDYALLVGIHELLEGWLCRKRGISEQSVTVFDVDYENKRQEGDFSEPGNDPQAPYFHEHQFATKIEMQIADELGVNWDEYDQVVNAL